MSNKTTLTSFLMTSLKAKYGDENVANTGGMIYVKVKGEGFKFQIQAA